MNEPFEEYPYFLQFKQFEHKLVELMRNMSENLQKKDNQMFEQNLKDCQKLDSIKNFLIQIENQRCDSQKASNDIIQKIQVGINQYEIPQTQNDIKLLVDNDQLDKIKNQVSGLFKQNNLAPNQEIISKTTDILIQKLDDVLNIYRASNYDNNRTLQLLQLNQQYQQFQADISQLFINLQSIFEPIREILNQQNEEFVQLLEQVKQLNQIFSNKLDILEYDNQDNQLIQNQYELEEYLISQTQEQQNHQIYQQPNYQQI